MALIKKSIFWIHLVCGLVAGLIILLMALTGILLAFEPQVVTYLERHALMVKGDLPPESKRMNLDELANRVISQAGGNITEVAIKSDPRSTVLISVGREKAIYVNPYTGEIAGETAKTAKEFFHFVEDIHRWLAMEGKNRDIGKQITGVADIFFVILGITGLYLWFPKKWSRQAFGKVTILNFQAKGKARDWNWHNVIGFWLLPFLLILAATGLIIKYTWASNLIFKVTGSPVPPAQQRENRPPGGGRGGSEVPPKIESLEKIFLAAQNQSPQWRSIILRLPRREGAPVNVTIEDSTSLHPYPRSLLTVNSRTAEVIKWESFDDQNLGRKVRSWVKPIHTGEAGGFLGQLLAALVSMGAVMLVWTGFALSWRRFFKRTKEEKAS